MVRKLIRLGLAGMVSVGLGVAAAPAFADDPVTGAAKDVGKATEQGVEQGWDTTKNAAKSLEPGQKADQASQGAKDMGQKAGSATEDAAKNGADATKEGADSAGEAAKGASDATQDAAKQGADATKDTAKKGADATKEGAKKAGDSAGDMYDSAKGAVRPAD